MTKVEGYFWWLVYLAKTNGREIGKHKQNKKNVNANNRNDNNNNNNNNNNNVRTHQHNTDSAVLQTARYFKTEVQRETIKMKESIAEKTK